MRKRDIIYKIISYTFFVVVLLMSYVKIANSSISKDDISKKLTTFEPVIKVLLSKGVDSAFIYKLISDKRTFFNEKFVRINVTNFNNPPDYKSVYNRVSVSESIKFLQENYDMLDSAEKKYSVPKEIITSILWVETKFGKVTGNHSVISVFLSTALANQANYIQMNRNYLLSDFEGNENELKELENKLIMKANKKTDWAIGELLALYEIYKKNPTFIFEVSGSWAGAFGYSQFLPSSYLKWAVDGNSDDIVDLFVLDDAIFSIANYLKSNGWNSFYESQKASVYHYNNSQEYVKAVFKLANKLKPKESDSVTVE
jgi:membrane-bound lytic murein transglycosylase B